MLLLLLLLVILLLLLVMVVLMMVGIVVLMMIIWEPVVFEVEEIPRGGCSKVLTSPHFPTVVSACGTESELPYRISGIVL